MVTKETTEGVINFWYVCVLYLLLYILLVKMMRGKALWLENYFDDLTPWETKKDESSFDDLHRHKRYLSLGQPQRFTSNTETHSHRTHYSLIKRHPTFKSLSLSKQRPRENR